MKSSYGIKKLYGGAGRGYGGGGRICHEFFLHTHSSSCISILNIKIIICP